MGAQPGSGFVFDNEKWAHPVTVKPFRMAKAPVTNAEFAAFIEDRGYRRQELWSEAGWIWREAAQAEAPVYWKKQDGLWMQRAFDEWILLPPHQPVIHVNWFEADAWCRWAGRRLPAEVEWELAAHTAQRRGFHWGDVWEWTGSSFRPYPGFAADPYVDYSAPWFGTHKVLRGASFATHARIKHLKYRNFYRPERDDIFSGFRSCAL